MEIVLYERELEVMRVLWERGPSTVAEVRDVIGDEMAYNTVLTVLRRLEEKGHVGHQEDGRAHRYHSLIDPVAVQDSALKRLTRNLFQNSPEMLLTHLVSGRKLSKPELRRLRELVDGELQEE